MRVAVFVCCVVLVSVSLIEGDPISVCPGGRRPIRCFINPCDLPQWKSSCNGDPTLECRADYCQGCEHVDFYDVTGVKVTCNDGDNEQNDQQQTGVAGELQNSNFWSFNDWYSRIRSLLMSLVMS